jgi:antitoxin component YwqK of YwqJK toxin-antitoxin module
MRLKAATLFIILLNLFGNMVMSQVKLTAADSVMTDTNNKILPVKKFYSVSLGYDQIGEKYTYRLNDKEVSKAVYDKYNTVWMNIDKCRPCVLESYDENDILLTKGVQFTDAQQGFWIEYYPNGKVKLVGNFKGLSKKHGTWTYFDDAGTVTKIEIYRNDKLIR